MSASQTETHKLDLTPKVNRERTATQSNFQVNTLTRGLSEVDIDTFT